MKNRNFYLGLSLTSAISRKSAFCATLIFTIALSMYLASSDVVASNAKAATSDPSFTCEITGSSKDGFDIHVSYDGENPKNCKATCTITKADGSTMDKTYENKVQKTTKAWFGGEAGLSGGPFSAAKISSSGCSS